MAKGKKTGGRDWKPGQSGNPKGRPKGSYAKANIVREYLNRHYMNDETKKTNIEILIEKITAEAFHGNDNCRKLLFNYYFGLPTQKIEADIKYGQLTDEEFEENLEGFLKSYDTDERKGEEDSPDNQE